MRVIVAAGTEVTLLAYSAVYGSRWALKAVNDGRADYTPVFLSEIEGLFESGAMPLDVALIHVSPPDAHGYCTLGTSVDAALAAASPEFATVATMAEDPALLHFTSGTTGQPKGVLHVHEAVLAQQATAHLARQVILLLVEGHLGEELLRRHHGASATALAGALVPDQDGHHVGLDAGS